MQSALFAVPVQPCDLHSQSRRESGLCEGDNCTKSWGKELSSASDRFATVVVKKSLDIAKLCSTMEGSSPAVPHKEKADRGSWGWKGQ